MDRCKNRTLDFEVMLPSLAQAGSWAIERLICCLLRQCSCYCNKLLHSLERDGLRAGRQDDNVQNYPIGINMRDRMSVGRTFALGFASSARKCTATNPKDVHHVQPSAAFSALRKQNTCIRTNVRSSTVASR